MKILIPIVIIFLGYTSLIAQEKVKSDTTLTLNKEFNVDLTNILSENELVPAISFKMKQKVLNKFDFMIAYANSMFILNRESFLNNKIENIHFQLSCKF